MNNIRTSYHLNTIHQRFIDDVYEINPDDSFEYILSNEKVIAFKFNQYIGYTVAQRKKTSLIKLSKMDVKLSCIFCILLFISCQHKYTGAKTEDRTPYQSKNGKRGYKCKNTNVGIIACEFNKTYPFLSDLAIVGVENGGEVSYGMIDTCGTYMIPPKYRSIDFPYGSFLQVSDTKKGILNLKGIPIIPTSYENIEICNDSLAIVSLNNKFGCYDLKTGEKRLVCIYDQIKVCSNGYIKVKKENKFGYFNPKGKMITSITYDYAGDFNNGLAPISQHEKSGFIDTTGHEKIALQFWRTGNFVDSMAVVEWSNGQLGIVNTKGEIVYRCESFGPGIPIPMSGLTLFFNKKYGFVNKKGEIVIPFMYDDVPWFGFIGQYTKVTDLKDVKKDSLYRYDEKAKHGLINKQNKLIYDFTTEYDFSILSDSLICLYNKETGKSKLVNSTKKDIIPYKYATIQDYNADFFMVSENGLFGLTDRLGREIIAPQYTKIERMADGMAFVYKNDNQIGCMDSTGKLVIACTYGEEFEIVDKFQYGFVKIKNRYTGKLGYLDKKGNEYWIGDEE